MRACVQACMCFSEKQKKNGTPGRFHLDLGNIFLDLMRVPRLHKEWERQRRADGASPRQRGERGAVCSDAMRPTEGHWDYSV